jgi:hypothetical protein
MASSFGKRTRWPSSRLFQYKNSDGKTLLLLRGNAYFGQFLMSHAGSHGVRLKPVHGAEDFPSLHWMGVGGEEGFCFHRGKEHGGRQTDACDY